MPFAGEDSSFQGENESMSDRIPLGLAKETVRLVQYQPNDRHAYLAGKSTFIQKNPRFGRILRAPTAIFLETRSHHFLHDDSTGTWLARQEARDRLRPST